MIPSELESKTVSLAPTDAFRIVIFTGEALRHDRFALRLQAEFGELVVGWFQVRPASTTSYQPATRLRRLRDVAAAARAVGAGGHRLIGSSLGRQVLAQRIEYLRSRTARRLRRRRPSETQREAEERLFGDEVRRLRAGAHISPQVVADPNDPAAISEIDALKPYFILTLGGGIYGKALRSCARGLALNQHDGWCPDYRGSLTVDWALYHRDLSKVANTVHVLTAGMDSGPILRRSIACLADDDTLESAFARSVALGTELMCETVRELIETRQARLFPQPAFGGRTYLAREMDDAKRREIDQALRGGLVARDVADRQAF